MATGIERARSNLRARLRERLPEIEQTALTRVHAISEPSEIADPEYALGLRAAVLAALEYALDAIEKSEDRAPQVPVELRVQAQRAAASGVSLDTVLRRYFAGYTLLGDFLMQEAEEGGLLGTPELKRLLRAQASLFDRLLETVTEEYNSVARSRADTAGERRAERVRRLLAGELLDTSDFNYDFDGHHVGVVAAGPNVSEILRETADSLGRRLLLVDDGNKEIWGWLGGRRALNPAELERLFSDAATDLQVIGVGEPAHGLAGWRLSHRQAKAALYTVHIVSRDFVRYADVALLVAVLHDELLASSLRQIYLTPLESEPDGGETARETLQAFFSAQHNVSSAAAALGITRHTAAKRLRAVETRLGRSLEICAPDLRTALRLHQAEQTLGRQAM